MRQLKAEYYKMKYSRASKWVLVFMAFIFFIPFVVGNDTLFMTFGDYRNIDSIGWICYIDDMNNVKAAEIARFALSINFFSWIGLIVYITTMVSAEFHQGTIRASVVYGINRTKLFLSKLLVINVHFFILYYIVETALGLGLAWKYGFHYKGEEFLIFIGMVTLNMNDSYDWNGSCGGFDYGFSKEYRNCGSFIMCIFLCRCDYLSYGI